MTIQSTQRTKQLGLEIVCDVWTIQNVKDSMANDNGEWLFKGGDISH